jgi:hypothetical protein
MKLFAIVFTLLISFNAYAADLIYKPQKDITAYELSQVLKIFYFDVNNRQRTVVYDDKDKDRLVNYYKTFDPSVQRHFYIKEEK